MFWIACLSVAAVDVFEAQTELFVVIYGPVYGPLGFEKDYGFLIAVKDKKRC